jgi:hypothetical protein
MKLQISVVQMLAELEAQVAYHRKQEAYHAEQEVHHREERARHAAELETAQARCESFRAAAESAGELVSQRREEVAKAQAQKPAQEKDSGKPATVSGVIRTIIGAKPAQEVFGATSLLREIQERKSLGGRIDIRTVGATLRRLHLAGEIHQVREGRAYYEAQYARGPAGKG